jgi:hypothetical protein
MQLPTRFQSLVTDSCSVRVHWCCIRAHSCSFVFTRVQFMFTRLPFVFILVFHWHSLVFRSCSLVFHLCWLMIMLYLCLLVSNGITYSCFTGECTSFLSWPESHPILTLDLLCQKHANVACSRDHIEFLIRSNNTRLLYACLMMARKTFNIYCMPN